MYFVDGVHDDLLTQLARISALKVISRTSVMSYRDTEKPIPLIGQELSVATVMEGSVQRAGDRVRINVQLIDAATDEHLWAEIYDRELTAANIFEIQSEIATAIAGALRAALTLEEAERLAIAADREPGSLRSLPAGPAAVWLAERLYPSPKRPIISNRQSIWTRSLRLAYAGLADAWQLQVDYGGLAVTAAIDEGPAAGGKGAATG